MGAGDAEEKQSKCFNWRKFAELVGLTGLGIASSLIAYVYMRRFLKCIVLSQRFFIVAHAIDTKYLPGFTDWVDRRGGLLLGSVFQVAAAGAWFYYRKTSGPRLAGAVFIPFFILDLAQSLVEIYMKCYPKGTREYTDCSACSRAISRSVSGSIYVLLMYISAIPVFLKPTCKQSIVEEEKSKESEKV